jgi:hypothetical protein
MAALSEVQAIIAWKLRCGFKSRLSHECLSSSIHFVIHLPHFHQRYPYSLVTQKAS